MNLFKKIIKLFYLLIYRFQKPKIFVYEALLSGNGSFVDIRYWLSRPDQVNFKASIYLIYDETGEKLNLMKIAKFGAIRTRHNKLKNTGVLLFYNRNGLIKHGSKVTIHLDKLIATSVEVK